MVNLTNVQNTMAAGFNSAKNYVVNNPGKVAAAVVTTGLVAGGVYFRADLLAAGTTACTSLGQTATAINTFVTEKFDVANTFVTEKFGVASTFVTEKFGEASTMASNAKTETYNFFANIPTQAGQLKDSAVTGVTGAYNSAHTSVVNFAQSNLAMNTRVGEFVNSYVVSFIDPLGISSADDLLECDIGTCAAPMFQA